MLHLIKKENLKIRKNSLKEPIQENQDLRIKRKNLVLQIILNFLIRNLQMTLPKNVNLIKKFKFKKKKKFKNRKRPKNFSFKRFKKKKKY